MASMTIGDLTLTVEDTAQCGRNGGALFQWTITSPAGIWTAADLCGPAAGPEPEESDMLPTLCSFLSAALESRSYRERTGRAGENEDLFPTECLDACEEHSDEIGLASMDPEECPTSGEVAGTMDDPFEPVD